jgi:glycosyltransferase involved in cell wall biosynthesis
MNESARRRKPRVVYWNNVPTPYMVERFNAVMARDNLDFQAWFTFPGRSFRSWALNRADWNFPYRFLPAVKLFGRVLPFPVPVFSSPKPDLIVMLYSDIPSMIGWWIARARGIKTAFWSQVTPDRWVRRAWWKELLKRQLLARVDATLGSGEDSRRYAMKYGTPPQRALILQHAIDGDFFARHSASARIEDRNRIRADLALKGVVFVYVGRLWWGKGLMVLLEAFASVQRESCQKVSLLLIGDGPEESALRQKATELGASNVVFSGFRQKQELPGLYAASDVFVFPTLGDPYGLVVDEAMACGLPVISSDVAGEIRDRVRNNQNGFVVAVDNVKAFASAMLALAGDAPARKRMGEESLRIIAGSTPTRWAVDFERCVEAILDTPFQN